MVIAAQRKNTLFSKLLSWEILPPLNFGRRSAIVLLTSSEDHTAYRGLEHIHSLSRKNLRKYFAYVRENLPRTQRQLASLRTRKPASS